MTPVEQVLFFVSLALYIVGAVLYTLEFFLRRDGLGSAAVTLTSVAWFSHTAALIVRCSVTGYAPMTNMYESLSFFAWCTVSMALVVRWKMGIAFINAFTAPLYIVLMALAYFFSPDRIPTLVPALQS